jgi:hypothetical protein
MAAAQTKEVCSTLAAAIPQATSGLRSQANALSALDWNTVISVSSSGMKRSALNAQRAHQDFAVALDKYIAALQDFTNEAQRCAR